MSNSGYQNYKAKCQGWSTPSISFGPIISNLSAYYSPAGSTNLISINGSNFYSYSTVSFGTYTPLAYFINSNIIQFYVPSSLNSGTYAVQIFNGSIPSNTVNYTIDNASGYWLLNPAGAITNTNTTNAALVNVSALSRGPPTTITDPIYAVPYNLNWFICDSSSDITITLPVGTLYTGREIMIKSINNGAILCNPDDNTVYSLNGNAGTTIIPSPSTGKWVTLVSNGTYWHTMQSNW